MPCVDTICNSVHCLEGPAELLLAVVRGCFCLHLESFSSVTTHGFLIIGVIFLFIFFSSIYIYLSCVFYVLKKYRSLALFALNGSSCWDSWL